MKKYKVFLDIEQEVQWLNGMSEQGYRLVYKEFGDYMFQKSEPKRYVYEVQKTKFKDAQEEEKYEQFLRGIGINVVKQNWGWWYLEKVNDGRSFELFTDAESKVEHYQILTRRLAIFSLIISVLLIENLVNPSGPWLMKMGDMVGIPLPLVINGVMLYYLCRGIVKYEKRMKCLRKEIVIQEK